MRKTHNVVPNPEELHGVKKKSFALPFNGGEIWFEHLDGMYQYTELVLEKLKNDSHTFLLLSKPAHIAFILDETLITEQLIDEIVRFYAAKESNLEKDKSITEIGSDSGYSSSNFATAFKKHLNVSPAEFRKISEQIVEESSFSHGISIVETQ